MFTFDADSLFSKSRPKTLVAFQDLQPKVIDNKSDVLKSNTRWDVAIKTRITATKK